MHRWAQRLVIGLIRLYQRTFSRVLPSTCRYQPTCSEYAVGAVRIHGVLKGLGLAGWRVMRCHPFATGGYDPVPLPHPRLEHNISRQSTTVELSDR